MRRDFFVGALLFGAAMHSSCAQTVKRMGDALQLALPASAVLYNFYVDDVEGRPQFAKSLLTTVAVTEGLKYSINAKRPNGGAHSFPSGHTSISFQSATFLQERYGSSLGIPAYALASVVGYSRVHERVHYTRDVVAGGLIGIGASTYFTSRWENAHAFQLVPTVYKHGIAINWATPFH